MNERLTLPDLEGSSVETEDEEKNYSDPKEYFSDFINAIYSKKPGINVSRSFLQIKLPMVGWSLMKKKQKKCF